MTWWDLCLPSAEEPGGDRKAMGLSWAPASPQPPPFPHPLSSRIPLPQGSASLCPTLQQPPGSRIPAGQGTEHHAEGVGWPGAGEQSVNRDSRAGERSPRNEEAGAGTVVERAWHGLWKMEA